MGDLFTSKIVQLFSDAVDATCPFCEHRYGADERSYLATAMSHLLSSHDGKIRHVGQQTTVGPDGVPWQQTTAILEFVLPVEEEVTPSDRYK
jgi:hypothetical protein